MTTKLPRASIATCGSCWGVLPLATTISPPTFLPEASNRWVLTSLSRELFTSLQTTTEEPLLEVADVASDCTAILVVLTRASVPERERRIRSSRASHWSGLRAALGAADGLVPLPAHCRKERRKRENMVPDLLGVLSSGFRGLLDGTGA